MKKDAIFHSLLHVVMALGVAREDGAYFSVRL
jgi:hypothetical protein